MWASPQLKIMYRRPSISNILQESKLGIGFLMGRITIEKLLIPLDCTPHLWKVSAKSWSKFANLLLSFSFKLTNLHQPSVVRCTQEASRLWLQSSRPNQQRVLTQTTWTHLRFYKAEHIIPCSVWISHVSRHAFWQVESTASSRQSWGFKSISNKNKKIKEGIMLEIKVLVTSNITQLWSLWFQLLAGKKWQQHDISKSDEYDDKEEDDVRFVFCSQRAWALAKDEWVRNWLLLHICFKLPNFVSILECHILGCHCCPISYLCKGKGL